MARVRSFLAGIDEAGRGPLAGPVTVGCVVFPKNKIPDGVKDSKQLQHKERLELYSEITRKALAFSVISIGHKRIDKINILQATRLGMRLTADRVAKQLRDRYSQINLHLLIDGNSLIETSHSQETIVDGDAINPLIGAASILAKVHRDNLMSLLDEKYPGYGFKSHKGYATACHRQSLAALGPSLIHRRSFAGVCIRQQEFIFDTSGAVLVEDRALES